MDISQIDKNFAVQIEINKTDIRYYDVLEEPFRIYGVYYHEGKFRRLPEEVAKTVSDGVLRLHSHTAGGRVRFRTDSPYIAIVAEMPIIGKMAHFALTGSAGFDLYVGTRYTKTFIPPFAIKGGFKSVAELGAAQMRDITIDFPLYSEITNDPEMKAYNKAEDDLNILMTAINMTITSYINPQDIATPGDAAYGDEEGGCTHNCSTCKGCHPAS